MFTIAKKEEIAPKFWRFLITAPDIARKHRAGQFVIILLDERGERIPLTIAASDAQAGTIALVVQEVGKTTMQLAALPVGANVFLFTQRYEVAQEEVTASIAVSTALALVTVPMDLLATGRGWGTIGACQRAVRGRVPCDLLDFAHLSWPCLRCRSRWRRASMGSTDRSTSRPVRAPAMRRPSMAP